MKTNTTQYQYSNYYNIKEIIILDDGDDEPLCIKTKYPIRYYNVPRCSIGDKRNMLVSLSQCDYVAFMDTDDMYDKDYIGYSIFKWRQMINPSLDRQI